MARLVIVPEDRLRALIDRAVRNAVEDVLSEATFVDVPTEPPQRAPRSKPASHMRPPTPSEQQAAPGKRAPGYVIGRAEGEFSYADVVAIEHPKPMFHFDAAWDAIKDKIVTDSDRARGSTRRALDSDSRFQRVEGRDGWYRRTDMEQLRMDE
ncbi:MAG: hypothetical protein RJQ04_13335 [Longimicrobiales bacterium]